MILSFAGELRNWPDSHHLALEAGFVATTEKKRRRHGTKKSIMLKMVPFQIERDTVFPLNMTSLISKPIPSKKVQTSIGVYSLTCPMCPSVSSFMSSSKTLPGAFFLEINPIPLQRCEVWGRQKQSSAGFKDSDNLTQCLYWIYSKMFEYLVKEGCMKCVRFKR